ncbi:MAG: BCAM0308 family protein [Dehalococcoidia bacterium]
MTWPTRRRLNELIQERIHDTYRPRKQPEGPVACPECGVVFLGGRWTWATRPDGAREELCPACRRIRDDYPAGIVLLKGAFLRQHEEELLNLVKNLEQAERAEHPLNRIMAIEELDDGYLITTTDIHLPRRIGEEVHRAYAGNLDYHYLLDGDEIRVEWSRDAE